MTKRGPVLPPTQELKPSRVLDPDIIAQAGKDANEKRHLAAQLPNKVLAAIDRHLDRHPDASNNDIARWLKGDPEIKPLVAHLKPRSLADKIGALAKNRRESLGRRRPPSC